MKKVAKLTSILICLAMAISLLASVTTAAPAKYTKLRISSSQVEVGMYTNTDLTGEIVNISANPNYEQEKTCLVDKGLKGGYWSKALKFNELKDNGGSTVPVIMFNLEKDGKPTDVGMVELSIRNYFDCMPLHFEVQVLTEANGTTWTSVFEQDDIEWMSQTKKFEFPAGNVAAYKLRVLFYDIGEPNIEEDTGTYETLAGDETRFSLAEIALYTLPEGSTPSTQPTTKPTEATNKPTEPKATEPKATEPKATEPEATEPEVTEPEATEPEVTEPEATEPEATEPEATEPEATEPEATEPEATEPEATEPEETEPEATQAPTDAPATNNDAKEEPKGNAGLIIGIVAAVVVIGAVVFFVIKKKK